MVVSKKSAQLKQIYSVLAGLLVLVALFFISLALSKYFLKNTTGQFDEIIAKKDYQAFAVFAKSRGPAKTYDLLKKKFSQNEPQAHDFAHTIGIVAHELQGLKGLSLCDTAFNYGCHHGFMESFLSQNGIEQISQIEQACQELGIIHSPSCLHGIGHGVMIDSAYDLNTALSSCRLLTDFAQSYCFDGVFMERVVGSMLTAENRITMTPETLQVPCRDIDQFYKNLCWRNQVIAWFVYFKGDTPSIGSQCLQIEPEFRRTCLESLGHNITMTGSQDPNSLTNLCRVLPDNAVSDECLVGVIKELMFEGKPPQIAENLCSQISPANRQYCFSLFAELRAQYRERFGR